jgi:hypothetical protein
MHYGDWMAGQRRAQLVATPINPAAGYGTPQQNAAAYASRAYLNAPAAQRMAQATGAPPVLGGGPSPTPAFGTDRGYGDPSMGNARKLADLTLGGNQFQRIPPEMQAFAAHQQVFGTGAAPGAGGASPQAFANIPQSSGLNRAAIQQRTYAGVNAMPNFNAASPQNYAPGSVVSPGVLGTYTPRSGRTMRIATAPNGAVTVGGAGGIATPGMTPQSRQAASQRAAAQIVSNARRYNLSPKTNATVRQAYLTAGVPIPGEKPGIGGTGGLVATNQQLSNNVAHNQPLYASLGVNPSTASPRQLADALASNATRMSPAEHAAFGQAIGLRLGESGFADNYHGRALRAYAAGGVRGLRQHQARNSVPSNQIPTGAELSY